ncbi:MAG TPA: sigma-70 family RNA polymerase sigma factor [Gemmataceae bacterium]
MSDASLQAVLRHVRRLTDPPAAGWTDAQLLARFVADRDEAAFELLLRRHGGAVFGVCRRLARRREDAEDAFQVTFLALARKAGSIGRRASVGSWLYKVAYRAALAARARTNRHAAVPMTDVPSPTPSPAADWADLRRTLDAAIHALPERYRVPFVLCELEGKTLAEAAKLLGRPRTTVGTRVARARQQLRRRLAHLGLPAAALAGLWADPAAADVPVSLIGSALTAAVRPDGPPAHVAALTEGVLRAMFVSKCKLAVAVMLLVATLVGGAGGLGYVTYAQDGPARPKDGRPAAARLNVRGWGSASDPDADCKFTVEKDRLTIAVPGTDHAVCIEQNRMNAPRVLRPVTGDFIAQVKVSGNFPIGGKSLVDTRRPFHGAGLLVWKDDHNYVRLERAQVIFDGQAGAYVNWELRKDGDFGRMGGAGELDLKDEPVWLRIERRGNTLYGSASADGVQWTTLEPMAVELPPKLLVGVVAGQNTTIGFAPTFEGFRLLQAVE